MAATVERQPNTLVRSQMGWMKVTAWAAMNLLPYAQKYYRFEYIPRRSASGEIVGYIIHATPARRDCEFHRSFTITDEGRVFWTLEPRAATLSDMYYNERRAFIPPPAFKRTIGKQQRPIIRSSTHAPDQTDGRPQALH